MSDSHAMAPKTPHNRAKEQPATGRRTRSEVAAQRQLGTILPHEKQLKRTATLELWCWVGRWRREHTGEAGRMSVTSLVRILEHVAHEIASQAERAKREAEAAR